MHVLIIRTQPIGSHPEDGAELAVYVEPCQGVVEDVAEAVRQRANLSKDHGAGITTWLLAAMRDNAAGATLLLSDKTTAIGSEATDDIALVLCDAGLSRLEVSRVERVETKVAVVDVPATARRPKSPGRKKRK